MSMRLNLPLFAILVPILFSPQVNAEVTSDTMLFLTESGGLKVPLTPPPLRNHGKCVVSLNRIVRWMAEQAEAKGIQVFPGFPGAKLVRDGQRVTGVQLQGKVIGLRRDYS